MPEEGYIEYAGERFKVKIYHPGSDGLAFNYATNSRNGLTRPNAVFGNRRTILSLRNQVDQLKPSPLNITLQFDSLDLYHHIKANSSRGLRRNHILHLAADAYDTTVMLASPMLSRKDCESENFVFEKDLKTLLAIVSGEELYFEDSENPDAPLEHYVRIN